MDIYNIIINDPLYLVISILLALIFIFTIIKRYSKWILGVLTIIALYIVYLIYIGQPIPTSTEELKKSINKNIPGLQ